MPTTKNTPETDPDAGPPIVAAPDDVAAAAATFKVTRSTGVVVPVEGKDDDGNPTYERVHVADGDKLPAGVPDAELNNLTALGFILPA